MRTLIATALTVTVAALALPTAPANAARAGLAPCEYEDSNHCVWDARHMGNGHGRSFVVSRHGVVRYVSHARAHRLLADWRAAHPTR